MVRLISSLVLLAAWVPYLHAEPLDRRQVPAGAVWLIHIDADAARDSWLGQRIRELWISQPEGAKTLEQARETFGVDPTRDIHSITIYGTTFAPDTGVVLARGKVDRPRLEGILSKLPNYHSSIQNGHTLYFWSETAPNRRHDSAGAFVGSDMIVIAPDGPAVLAALDVLEGKADGLPINSPLTADAAPGAIILAGTTGLAEAKGLSIQSPVIRQCESGSFCAGEQAGEVFVRGRIVTGSADVASGICDFIVGARAGVQLQTPESVNLIKLLRPLKVIANDKTVEVQWQFSSIELVKIVQAEQARRIAATQPGSDH